VTASPESLISVKSGAGSPSVTKASSSRRALGVVRVSRKGDRDGERFVSPVEQEERIRAACERDDLALVEIVEEIDVSGGTPLEHRLGLRRAVESIEAGEAEVLVVAYFDRLVRSLAVQREVLERVEDARGSVLAVDVGEIRSDTASRWLSSTMLGMVAEYHRRVTGERTADAKRRAVARGVAPFPRLPPGLRRGQDGRVELVPDQVPVVAEAFRRRLSGASIAEVRAFLRENRIERSYHGTLTMLSSRLMLGELSFGGLLNPESHPPIVDLATWQAVQKIRSPRGRRAKSERLLARLGVLRCGTCGARMVVGTAHHGEYALYRCPPVGDCTRKVTISAEMVEGIVVEAVRDLLDGLRGTASLADGLEAARRELELRERELDRAVYAFADLDDVEAARERLRELREARGTARERVADLEAAAVPALTVTASDWNELTPDERRALIQAVLARVEVSPGRGPGRVVVYARGE
jgi:site-specific DNA recombinase